jgi:predicted transcriptional regulator
VLLRAARRTELRRLHRQLHDHFEHVEGDLGIRLEGRLQERHQVRLQHAPRAERAVSRHDHRIVTTQVALQVGDALLALGADHVSIFRDEVLAHCGRRRQRA